MEERPEMNHRKQKASQKKELSSPTVLSDPNSDPSQKRQACLKPGADGQSDNDFLMSYNECNDVMNNSKLILECTLNLLVVVVCS